MPGIYCDIIEHHLGVDPTHKQVRQKKKSFNIENYAMIKEEVDKQLVASFIREAHYPEWLSIIVMVKKANKK